jgi:hypothetical protein
VRWAVSIINRRTSAFFSRFVVVDPGTATATPETIKGVKFPVNGTPSFYSQLKV